MNDIESMIKEFNESHNDNLLISETYSAQSDIDLLYNCDKMHNYNSKLFSEGAYTLLLRMEIAGTQRASKLIKDEIHRRYLLNNTIKWNYIDAPYFTEDEIQIQLDKFNEHYHRDGRSHASNFHRIGPETYRNRIKELQELIRNTEDPDDIARYKSELIRLGWNPEIDYDEVVGEKAKDRVITLYNEQMSKTIIIDCSKDIVKFTNINESYNDTNVTNLIIFEGGSSYIHTGRLENIRLNGFAEVYSIYSKSSVSDITNNSDRIFNLPMNYRASIISQRYNESNIIFKTYSGLMEECDYNSINNFNSNYSRILKYVKPLVENYYKK